jgi:hypothetical protein
MKIAHIICLSFLSLLLTSCSTNNPVAAGLGLKPTAAKSEYLRTEGGGFIFKKADGGGIESCKYAVILMPVSQSPRSLYLRTRFENPADSSHPFVIDSEIPRNSSTFTLESPPVRGLQPYRSYKVDIQIYDDPERAHQISQHVQYVQSIVAF